MADEKKSSEKGGARASKSEPPPPIEEGGDGILDIIREWGDALVIAFVLAMFVRVFVVELFKIPTGSMTPTLLGDVVADVDVDGDGLKDLVVKGQGRLVFINKGDRYEIDEKAAAQLTEADMAEYARQGLLRPEYDRILVNKFAYWRTPPDRGDVVVFKVPSVIWDPAKPIYIKRCVGLPGDTLTFNEGHLVANGTPVTEPKFFQHQRYTTMISAQQRYGDHPWIKARMMAGARMQLEEVKVPEDGIFAMGDNTNHSLDSRYWGEVPLDNIKGKAFVRYWPLKKLKIIK